MRILKRDAHALERNGVTLLIGHLVGITRDLNLLKHLAHGDGQAAIATLPNLFGATACVLRNHLGRDHDSHVLLGERGGINEHHMVASKVHSFKLRAIERTTRQFLDLGIKGQRQPAAHIGPGETAFAKRLDRRIVLESRRRKARAVFERINAD